LGWLAEVASSTGGCGVVASSAVVVIVDGSVEREGVVVDGAVVVRAAGALDRVWGAAVDAGAAVAAAICSAVVAAERADETVAAGASGVTAIRTVVDVAEAVAAAADVAVGAVVPEASAAPVAAVEAGAEVAEAVVDAPVVAYIGSPVAGVPEVSVGAVAPVAGRPESAGVGSENPGARDPFVTVTGPYPVAGRPDIAVTGGGGLFVVGDRGRRLLYSLKSAVLYGCVILEAVIGRSGLTLVWIRIAVLLVGRRRRGVLRLRDDGGDYEGCCQCGGGNRIFEETILRESIFEETRGRHGFRLPAPPSFVRHISRATGLCGEQG
jgi:hypothetical protein